MCGILIFKTNKINQEIENVFKNCLNDLSSRGPDEKKIVKNKNILLGFTRLSINDLKTASQPFKSLCGRYTIVFNGEIVNYKDLADNLRRDQVKLMHGHEAEVIINLYIKYKEKCVDLLRGFFAFVIIENKTNNIFATVDRFSIKPLYYYESKKDDLFIITSDYSTLLKQNFLTKKLNFDKLIDYFALARDLNEETIYKDIKKLAPSTILIKKNNYKKIFKYWHPKTQNNLVISNLKDAVNMLHAKFTELQKLWGASDVQNSLCLSTGLDSQVLKNYLDGGGWDIKKIHVKESKRRSLNIDNLNELKVTRSKTIVLFNNLIKECYNPFPLAHVSCTSLFELYNYLKLKKIKTTINGEGADEIFGGYPRYQRQLKLLKRKKMKFESSILDIYKRDISALAKASRNYRTLDLNTILARKIKKINLTSKINEDKMLEFDQVTWIPVLIQRHDVIGMHSSVEVRPPFLDHELVEIVNQISTNFKFNLFKRKIILHDLLKNKFHQDYLHKKKLGTPNIFLDMLNNKKELSKFRESVFYGEISNFIDPNKALAFINTNKINKYNFIFLWRLYVITKILNKF